MAFSLLFRHTSHILCEELTGVSAVSGDIDKGNSERCLPLLACAEATRPLFWHRGKAIDSGQFLADVARIRAWLPAGVPILNLCENRYDFAVAFAAVAANGQCNLLPGSRAPQAVAELLAAHPRSVAIASAQEQCLPPRCRRMPEFRPGQADSIPQIPGDQCVAIGHTSGSTGQPTAHRKTWAQLLASNARNHGVLGSILGDGFHLIATVPSQHMYGLEMSIVLPFGGDVSVTCEKPFFAGDIIACIDALPAPRALVTTPLHLRALLDAALPIPPLQAIVTATAPLSRELAQAAEQASGARVIEVFGSTETCVIAHRQTAREEVWTLHEGVETHAQPDGTRVSAPWLPEDVLLADLMEQPDPRHFLLRGRHADMLEIAGKRASLNDLTRRLLDIPGVEDAAVLQVERAHARGARRLTALVVAPDLSEQHILDCLRQQIDPVFLPRPLYRVGKLPRNSIGKLPRAALLDMLAELEA